MKKIISIICAIILFSCVSHDVEDVRMLKQGMSKRELKYYMGEPWLVEVDSDEEEWYFSYMYGSYKQHLAVTIIGGKIKSFYTY